ncbi:unnamed protein product [Vitrella brassicaformis CCMP3155]|uniref:SAM domain-containing protein n=2 Tax=Vitrella brassicaformis TaxID=1169539 RepID=A0A0G4GGF0_VITBC|nr:unnamed protein product [Vitrella brassicaformis CCMP3155]|eukprot:CEM28693.1 unnamed protein product [Vitrella brassicaformis CCMP3155]
MGLDSIHLTLPDTPNQACLSDFDLAIETALRDTGIDPLFRDVLTAKGLDSWDTMRALVENEPLACKALEGIGIPPLKCIHFVNEMKRTVHGCDDTDSHVTDPQAPLIQDNRERAMVTLRQRHHGGTAGAVVGSVASGLLGLSLAPSAGVAAGVASAAFGAGLGWQLGTLAANWYVGWRFTAAGVDLTNRQKEVLVLHATAAGGLAGLAAGAGAAVATRAAAASSVALRRFLAGQWVQLTAEGRDVWVRVRPVVGVAARELMKMTRQMWECSYQGRVHEGQVDFGAHAVNFGRCDEWVRAVIVALLMAALGTQRGGQMSPVR